MVLSDVIIITFRIAILHRSFVFLEKEYFLTYPKAKMCNDADVI